MTTVLRTMLLVLPLVAGCLQAPTAKGRSDPGGGGDTPAVDDPGSGTDPGDDPGHSGGCVQALSCMTHIGCASTACATPCMVGLDPDAVDAMSGILDCFQSSCSEDPETQPYQAASCLYSVCESHARPCTAAGTAGCGKTLTCVQGCGLDTECAAGCLDEATYEGRLGVLKLVACLEAWCPEALTNPGEAMTCIQMTCGTPYLACK